MPSTDLQPLQIFIPTQGSAHDAALEIFHRLIGHGSNTRLDFGASNQCNLELASHSVSIGEQRIQFDALSLSITITDPPLTERNYCGGRIPDYRLPHPSALRIAEAAQVRMFMDNRYLRDGWKTPECQYAHRGRGYGIRRYRALMTDCPTKPVPIAFLFGSDSPHHPDSRAQTLNLLGRLSGERRITSRWDFRL